MQETIYIYNLILNTDEFYIGQTSTISVTWTNNSGVTETQTVLFNIVNVDDNTSVMQDRNTLTLWNGESKDYIYNFSPTIEGTYKVESVIETCQPLTCIMNIV